MLSIAKHSQRGIMLLEALIGVLIFSIGIIAMLALQASAMSTYGESKWRASAAFLSNQLIAQAWNDYTNLTAANYNYNPGSGSGAPSTARPPRIQNWFDQVQTSLPGQKGVSGNFAVADTAPIVTLTACVVGTVTAGCPSPNPSLAAGTLYGNILSVTVRWRLAKSSMVRQHATSTYISMN